MYYGQGSTLIILEICYQCGGDDAWDSRAGSTVTLPWSGEVSRDSDCLELPLEYAFVNKFGPMFATGGNMSGSVEQVALRAPFPVTVALVEALSVVHLAGAVLVPASLLDWQIVCTHKQLIEDSLLQKVDTCSVHW
jgi:hypothetical protein